MDSVEVKLTGEVYKTGLRYFLKEKANKLNINGFVKYDNNSSVLIIANGNGENISRFIIFCKTGNPDSEINKMEIKQCRYRTYTSFNVINEH